MELPCISKRLHTPPTGKKQRSLSGTTTEDEEGFLKPLRSSKKDQWSTWMLVWFWIHGGLPFFAQVEVTWLDVLLREVQTLHKGGTFRGTSTCWWWPSETFKMNHSLQQIVLTNTPWIRPNCHIIIPRVKWSSAIASVPMFHGLCLLKLGLLFSFYFVMNFIWFLGWPSTALPALQFLLGIKLGHMPLPCCAAAGTISLLMVQHCHSWLMCRDKGRLFCLYI